MNSGRLFDFHTHILFDVDHGVQKQEEMEQLFDVYEKAGFGIIVLTPHLFNPFVVTKIENIRANFETAQKLAEQRNIKLYLGSELYLDGQTDIKTLPVANEYALVEFPVDFKPVCLDLKLGKLCEMGFTPVIAHIERYKWLNVNSEEVEMFRELGCKIQVNVSGIESKKALPYIKAKIVDIIASDNHGDVELPLKLRNAVVHYPEIYEKMLSLNL